MRKIILTLLAISTVGFANAKDTKSNDEGTFYKGVKVFNVGIGLGGYYGTPIQLGLEYGVSPKIGIGAQLGYASKSYTLTGYADKYKVSDILVSARGNYHFYTKKKLDAYVGLMLGYDVASVKWPSSIPSVAQTSSYGGLVWGGQLGARYYFTPAIAAYAEVGYGIGLVNLGAAFKF